MCVCATMLYDAAADIITQLVACLQHPTVQSAAAHHPSPLSSTRNSSLSVFLCRHPSIVSTVSLMLLRLLFIVACRLLSSSSPSASSSSPSDPPTDHLLTSTPHSPCPGAPTSLSLCHSYICSHGGLTCCTVELSIHLCVCT
eukprot:GHVU01179579.1.p1 GENE.GHVU01179579.1~~GHVU01179579.1.p1  ORF type:complete len:142 (-),score=14.04 GHVU01179579.1:314-739(-)